jgi:hypothetical protein
MDSYLIDHGMLHISGYVKFLKMHNINNEKAMIVCNKMRYMRWILAPMYLPSPLSPPFYPLSYFLLPSHLSPPSLFDLIGVMYSPLFLLLPHMHVMYKWAK